MLLAPAASLMLELLQWETLSMSMFELLQSGVFRFRGSAKRDPEVRFDPINGFQADGECVRVDATYLKSL